MVSALLFFVALVTAKIAGWVSLSWWWVAAVVLAIQVELAVYAYIDAKELDDTDD